MKGFHSLPICHEIFVSPLQGGKQSVLSVCTMWTAVKTRNSANSFFFSKSVYNLVTITYLSVWKMFRFLYVLQVQLKKKTNYIFLWKPIDVLKYELFIYWPRIVSSLPVYFLKSNLSTMIIIRLWNDWNTLRLKS